MTLLINSLSHELVTPLTEIIQLTDESIINKRDSAKQSDNHKFSSKLDQSIKEIPDSLTIKSIQSAKSASPVILSKINQTANRMCIILTSLMAYSQIINGNFDLDNDFKFNVKSMLLELAGYFKHRCQQKKIQLQIQCNDELVLISDRKRVIGVLFIFLDNAIKFTNKAGSVVRIVIEYSSESTSVVFKVVDTGVGIGEKDMETIAKTLKKPFCIEKTRSSAGLGIGLRVAQSIISQLSRSVGDLQFQSKVGVGTTVQFELQKIPVHTRPLNTNPHTISSVFNALATITPSDVAGKNLHQIYNRERNLSDISHLAEGVLTASLSFVDQSKDFFTRELVKRTTMNRISTFIVRQESSISSQSYDLKDIISSIRRRSSSSSRLSAILKQIVVKKIMIVDDEIFLLEFMRDLLEQWNIEVYTASSPERAIEIGRMFAQVNKFIDVVFMDYNMPMMTGPECTKVLKSVEFKSAFGKSNFVAFTAQDDKMVKDQFRDVGVTRFMFKPFSYSQMKEYLQSINIIDKD